MDSYIKVGQHFVFLIGTVTSNQNLFWTVVYSIRVESATTSTATATIPMSSWAPSISAPSASGRFIIDLIFNWWSLSKVYISKMSCCNIWSWFHLKTSIKKKNRVFVRIWSKSILLKILVFTTMSDCATTKQKDTCHYMNN